jgi:hypothetical protein
MKHALMLVGLILIGFLQEQLHAQQDQLRIFLNDNTEYQVSLTELRKIDFTGSQFRLYETNGNSTAWNYNEIGFYTFRDTIVSTSGDSPVESPEFEIYPNPAANNLQIYYHLKEPQEVNISLFSSNGKLLDSRNLNSSFEGTEMFDLSEYPAGQYFVFARSKDSDFRKLFIKN